LEKERRSCEKIIELLWDLDDVDQPVNARKELNVADREKCMWQTNRVFRNDLSEWGFSFLGKAHQSLGENGGDRSESIQTGNLIANDYLETRRRNEGRHKSK
jgi:hypothetical protein